MHAKEMQGKEGSTYEFRSVRLRDLFPTYPFEESECRSLAHMFWFVLCFLWVTNLYENNFELRPQGKMPRLVGLYFVTLKKGLSVINMFYDLLRKRRF